MPPQPVSKKENARGLYYFSVVQVPHKYSATYERRQFAYGQVCMNGLKNIDKYVPFEMNVIFTVDLIRGVILKQYVMYTPPRASVQVNGVIVPVVDSNGEPFLTIEPNKDYWCRVANTKAFITTSPVYGSRGFYIGRISDPQPYVTPL